MLAVIKIQTLIRNLLLKKTFVWDIWKVMVCKIILLCGHNYRSRKSKFALIQSIALIKRYLLIFPTESIQYNQYSLQYNTCAYSRSVLLALNNQVHSSCLALRATSWVDAGRVVGVQGSTTPSTFRWGVHVVIITNCQLLEVSLDRNLVVEDGA